MGPAVISLVLRELQERCDHWFAALRALTGENPVPRGVCRPGSENARALVGMGAGKGVYFLTYDHGNLQRGDVPQP